MTYRRSMFLRMVEELGRLRTDNHDLRKTCDLLFAQNKELLADLLAIHEDFERTLETPCPQCGAREYPSQTWRGNGVANGTGVKPKSRQP